jgi:hypothetical protein
MSGRYQFKLLISHASGFSMDALHVVAGVLLQLGVAWLTRSTVGRWRPWLVVLALELINEGHDLWVEQWPVPGQQYGEGLKDIILTMALPTLLLIVARRRPGLLQS